MTSVWPIFKREFAAYFSTPLAYVFIVIFLFAMGAFTFYLGHFYDNGVADYVTVNGELPATANGTFAYANLSGSVSNPGNVLWVADGAMAGPHFVDFDDSRAGPAVQDLWMLISGDRAEMSRQLVELLEGYEDFAVFDRRELHLIEGLRTLRLIHYAAWLARRWDDPAFPAAFPWFNTQRYWQDRILELREQIALMDEPPLDV